MNGRRTPFKLNKEPRMVEKVLKGESVRLIQLKSGAKAHCCNEFLRKETEMERVCRKFAEHALGIHTCGQVKGVEVGRGMH